MPAPKKDLFDGVKPPTVAERARKDFAEFYAHPCRRDARFGATLWFAGWDGGPRVHRWDGQAWGRPFLIAVADLKRTVPADLPPGASPPEELK